MRILIPTDGSVYSQNAARVAAKLALDHDYRLIILHVIPDKGFSRKTWQNEGAEKVIANIEELLLKAGCEKKRIEHFTEDGNAAEKIVEMAREKKVDRIVMGTQGKSGLKTLLGSVTEKVLQISDTLVLVVPPNYKADDI